MEKENNILGSSNENQENSIENVFEKRREIINALVSSLEGNPKVIATFLAGADAHDAIDEYSDIDFDIVVSDADSIDEIEKIVEETLQKFSPIKTELRVSTGNGLTVIHQFEKISKFLHVDVLYMTNAEKINKDEVNVLFDKEDVIKVKDYPESEVAEKIKNRVEVIEKYNELRQTYVERALNRGLYLEAEEKYRELVLKNLIEALRLQYCPQKSDYHVKHISKDLPEDIVKEIENLFKVTSVEEIREKNIKANELLTQTLEKLKQ
jgi:hypothetical protein